MYVYVCVGTYIRMYVLKRIIGYNLLLNASVLQYVRMSRDSYRIFQ